MDSLASGAAVVLQLLPSVLHHAPRLLLGGGARGDDLAAGLGDAVLHPVGSVLGRVGGVLQPASREQSSTSRQQPKGEADA